MKSIKIGEINNSDKGLGKLRDAEGRLM